MKKILISLIILLLNLSLNYSQNRRAEIGYIDMSTSSIDTTVDVRNITSGILYIYPETVVGDGGSYTISIGADIDNDGTISTNEYTVWSSHVIINNTTQSWDIGNLNCESIKIILSKGNIISGYFNMLIVYKSQIRY